MTILKEDSPKSFLEIERAGSVYRPVEERLADWSEVERRLDRETIHRQTARCINCGIPYCHGSGCPFGNRIPDFNRAVRTGDLHLAWDILSETSPFPEFTSRICPALCEASCSAGPEFGAVTIRQIEKTIVETAFERGWVEPDAPRRVGRRVAVIGSGPAGLAAAQSLNRRGYTVTVFEKEKRPGGLLRYGIPEFKLEKRVIDRRLRLMRESGIEFVCSTRVGIDVSPDYLLRKNDALVVATGTPTPRDLDIPGRELKGIHFALELLGGQNRYLGGEIAAPPVSAKGKRVVIIGGGDTGSDCLGTALRQGALSVLQIEIMPKPPVDRSPSTPWPQWPYMLRTSSSHLEGGGRRWSLLSKRFLGSEKEGEKRVEGIEVYPVDWSFDDRGKPLRFVPQNDDPEIIPCDLVLLALGFLKPDPQSPESDLRLDGRENVFYCGDAATGPSLVVRAAAGGLEAAEKLDGFFRSGK